MRRVALHKRRFLMISIFLLTICSTFHAGALPNEPAPLQDAQKQIDYITLEGARVRFSVQGEGPAVILVHGFASSLNAWDSVVGPLSQDHKVVALDLKGFGWSDRPAGDYSPAAQARIVLALADHLNLEDFDLVAHSWGASVALRLAMDAPDRVRKIALYDAWVYAEQLPTFFWWSRTPFLGELMFDLWYTERTDEKMAGAFYDKRYVTEAFVDVVEEQVNRPGTVAAALQAVRDQRYEEYQNNYRKIPHETLLLWGENDAVTRLEFGEILAADLPNARLITYPRCGHFPMIEANYQSTRDLLEFLKVDTLQRVESVPVVAPQNVEVAP